MHVIPLLFSAKPDSERLHQAAFTVLLKKTRLLARLTGRELQAGSVKWEPEGGATDLLVEATTGEKIWIELKIDSGLSRSQIEAQLKYNTPPSTLIYVLLGASEIAHGARWGRWTEILGGRQSPAIIDGRSLSQSITDTLDPEVASEVRDLADGYKLVLAELEKRTQQYRDKPVGQFNEHDYLGFFDSLRTMEPLGTTSTVSPVRAKGRHFVCCAWAGAPSLGLYFQFENQFLRLKLHSDELGKKDRKLHRKRFFDAARDVANALGISLEATKGRIGGNMTLANFPFELTSSDPSDSKVRDAVRAAHNLVLETGKRFK